MTERSSLPRYLAALLAVVGLALGAAAAHAGQSKGTAVRTAGLHGKGGHGFSFERHDRFDHGHFKHKRFHKHRKRPDVVRRRDHKRRTVFVPGYAYRYDRGYRYRYDPQPAPRYQAEASPAAPSYQDRPVTPKWIHVSSLGGTLGASGAEGAYGEGGLGNNCLSVKTEITVDGQAMDAFGEACLTPDGAWVLRPSEGNR